LDLFGEAVRVLDAFDVAPGARIPVDQPRSADGVGHLQHDGAQTLPSQFLQHVEPGEAGTDDHRIESGIVDSRHLVLPFECSNSLYRKAYSKQ
jgi:hypothetical protein